MYAAEYLGMPVSATILTVEEHSPAPHTSEAIPTPISTQPPPPSAASMRALLRSTATAELRLLSSLAPSHPRLARTYASESVTPRVPVRVMNGYNNNDSNEGGDISTTGKRIDAKTAEAMATTEVGETATAMAAIIPGHVALILVGELVEGGTLRARVAAVRKGTFLSGAARSGPGSEVGSDFSGDSQENGKKDENLEWADDRHSEKTSVGLGWSENERSESSGEDEDGGGGAVWRWHPEENTGTRLRVKRRRVIADIAEGLAFLHERGVVHGALSSENVLLDAEGRAKVRK